ncbi:MAG: D-alanyl-D-alanine carboxypeptidase/D-alanyl-D-alanine-endopeptidase [Burkholderiales bacterium]|nr:D-alanyl-D-alanine carboxypeptidase/D-alanyl-D-alanine-endopeptidase [Burkholderiales bacterium]
MRLKQIWALGLCVIGHAALAALPEAVTTALKQVHVPESAVGIMVMPLDGGGALLEHNADTALNPASTMKLVTTSAALDVLGPAFQWHTGLYTDGTIDGDMLKGNLYLKGGGDPSMTFERLWLMLRELKARGVRHVTGDLVLDRRYFALPPVTADANFDDQPERAYNVLPDALQVGGKALRFDIESDAQHVSVRTEPTLDGVSVRSRFRISNVPCDQWRAGWGKPEFETHGSALTVTLQGSFPRDCKQSRYLSVLDPVGYVDRLTRGLWAELGGDIQGGTRQGAVPASGSLLADQASPALASVIRDMNKWSLNTMARSLYLTLGAEHPLPDADSATAAAAVIRGWLFSQALVFPELTLENGSGLSRNERISPRHMAQLIAHTAHSVYGPELLASLPILGVDGTLQHRLTNTGLVGRGHLKTGTLDDSKALAGVLRDRAGRDWVVVAIVNHPRAEAAQGAMDRLMEWVWQGATP